MNKHDWLHNTEYTKISTAINNGEATIEATTAEGTCQLISWRDQEYVVLCDNTVITREEDNAFGLLEAFFPYNKGD